MRLGLMGVAIAISGWAGAVQAQGFDPRADCDQILQQQGAADRMMLAAWTFGFLAAQNGNVRPVDAQNNETLLANVARVCAANPGVSLLDLVKGANSPEPEPGSEADARALLMRFFEPGADHRALTQALFPTEAEVRAVYADPLANSLWSDYRQQMTPDVAFVPKPGQSDLVLIYATTGALAARKPVLGEFPGGYKDVAQFFRIDVPIVRFKFVKPGETTGLAFDGLVFINGRWVVMPKPWRSLPY